MPRLTPDGMFILYRGDKPNILPRQGTDVLARIMRMLSSGVPRSW
jgi:hypothetical protein